jgi:DNA modification methylase
MAYKNRIIRHAHEKPDQLLSNPFNWRLHSQHQNRVLDATLSEIGWVQSVIVNQTTGHIVDGHLRVSLAIKHDEPQVPVVYIEVTENEEKALLALIDPIAGLAAQDDDMLRMLIDQVEIENATIQGFLDDLAGQEDVGGSITRAALAEQFLVPPFSVLDARQGYWTDRKRQWLALGIRSELGRGSDGDKTQEGMTYGISAQPGDVWDRKAAIERRDGRDYTWQEFADLYPDEIRLLGDSIFDPVLCEIAYRWFSPPGGKVLDPFAGGSVRGVVAAMTGRHYTGIELRGEQVKANRQNWQDITGSAAALDDDTPDLTPVERRGEYWFKRDDTFTIANVSGGKARTCWALAQGAPGLVTAGSRSSPQVNIVAHIAQRLGIPARVHVPEGELTAELIAARTAGAEIIQHKAGYNSVIVKRARDDAKATGYREIPFGMECPEAIKQTRKQVANLPFGNFGRLVIPCGSGMSLAGVLWGLIDQGRTDVEVLAVQVGADPTARLNRYAPPGWRDLVQLRPSGQDYHDAAPAAAIEGIGLDPHYEAKCLPFLEPNDLLWIVGIRQTEQLKGLPAHRIEPAWIQGDSRQALAAIEGGYDLLFSCPPYADLEVYSDDPADISAMDYQEFLTAYRDIIAQACAKLAPNRFAVWVVGDIRDHAGNYRNLIGETVRAFEDAGLHLYNEAILVTPTGSLAMRAGNMFRASRKLGKAHQNVMMFLKGETGTPPALDDIADAIAHHFGQYRELLDAYRKVLVFAAGDPKTATQAIGPVVIAEEPE